MKVIKHVYEGITCFPEKNEFWNLYIVLMKEKDFFLNAFARQTLDRNYPAHYQYAYFSLDGHVFDLNLNMTTQLVMVFREIILEKQTEFRKELHMATLSPIEKKIKAIATELGELMKTHNDKEAWTKAGELNSLLKSEQAQQLPAGFIEPIRRELSGYYHINGDINKLHKQLYAKGNKLIELANQ